MFQQDNGTYADQGEQLGEMIAKLCAAEGKFRQLNAIKEGLDVQLVKQAHFLLLVARDLQSDIGKNAGHNKFLVVHFSFLILALFLFI